jgi:hypothetical protein
MRFLELFDPVSQSTLHVHPRLAVVEADRETRAAMVGALESVFNGGVAEPAALVEVHGILMALDGPATVLLALDGAVRPVIAPTELPPMTNSRERAATRHAADVTSLLGHRDAADVALVDAVRRRDLLNNELQVSRQASATKVQAAHEESECATATAERDQLQAALARLNDQRVTLNSELERRAAAAAATPQLLEGAQIRLADTRAELEDVTQRLAAAERAYQNLAAPSQDPWVDENEALALPELQSRVAAAAEDVRHAEEALATAREASLSIEAEQVMLDQQRASVISRRDALLAQLALLDLADPAPVVAALEAFEEADALRVADETAPAVGATHVAPDPTPLPADPPDRVDPLDLADQMIELEARRRHLTSQTLADHGADFRAVAMARLDRARAELADAQRLTHRAMLDPDARRQIETMHEDVLAAQDRADRKLMAGNARKRLIELREEEQTMLAGYGLNSFSDYLLTSSTAGRPDPANELRLTVARAELIDAERALVHLEAGDGPDPELLAIEAEQADAHQRAIALLGGEPEEDLVTALRQFRPAPQSLPVEPARPPSVVVPVQDVSAEVAQRAQAAEQRVVDALASIGIGVREGSGVIAARQWVADRSEAERSQRELIGRIAECDSALDGLDRPAVLGGPVTADQSAFEARLAHCAGLHDQLHADLEHARRSEITPDQIAAREQDRAAQLAAALSELEAHQARRSDALAAVRTAEASVAEHVVHVADTDRALEDLRTQAAELGAEVRSRAEAAAAADARARAARARADALVSQPGVSDDDIARLEADLAAADNAVSTGQRGLAGLTSALQAAHNAPIDAEPLSADELDAVEMFLLSRLAAQRSVAFVGSVPVIIDNALADMPAVDAVYLMNRLDRMSETIQVVYLTDDDAVLQWATALHAERGALAAYVVPA